MRWFVEVTPGGGAKPAEKWVVEAAQWQPALKAARALRGDPVEMPGLSIELLEDGYRAVDPTTMARYLVRKAPDDTPLSTQATSPNGATTGTGKGKGPAPAKAAKGAESVAKDDKKGASVPSRPSPASVAPRPSASTRPSPGDAATTGEKSAASSGAAASASRFPSSPPSSALRARLEATVNRVMLDAGVIPTIPPPSGPSVDGAVLLSQRTDEPSTEVPLAYCESVWCVPAGTPETAVIALLRQQLEPLRQRLASRATSKMVRIAVFDHRFDGRPERPPMATLTWKDWKGEPEIESSGAPLARLVAAPVSMPPLMAALVAGNTPSSAPAPSAPLVLLPPPVAGAPAVAHLADAVPIPAEPTHAEPTHAEPTHAEPPLAETAQTEPMPAPAGAPFEPAEATATAPARDEAEPLLLKTPSSKPPSGRRLSGDELLADLFEAVHELQFARDAIEGAEFALTLALEKLQSRVGLVHLYDINAREFVVVRVSSAAASLEGFRTGEKEPLIAQAMRARRAVVVAKATEDERVKTGRWMKLDVPLVSVLCAPVELAGRFLGVIELANPRDGSSFTEGDGHALTYIAEQFAELVGQRGIFLGPDRAKT